MLLERRSRPVRGVKIVSRREAPFGVQIIPTRRISVDDVRKTLRAVTPAEGAIVTSALNTVEQEPFLEAGFVELESLHLLRHHLREWPRISSSAKIRGAKRADLREVLALDRLSFDEFWALDRNGLLSARRATPIHRYVVAEQDGRVLGYAVTGSSGSMGFLQRVAVHPDARGQQIGAHLIIDAVEWVVGRGALSMMVNTQTSNEHAFALYKRLGFETDDEQLKVLTWP